MRPKDFAKGGQLESCWLVWWDDCKRSDALCGLNILPGRGLSKERDQTLPRLGLRATGMCWREKAEGAGTGGQPWGREEGRQPVSPGPGPPPHPEGTEVLEKGTRAGHLASWAPPRFQRWSSAGLGEVR